MKDSKKKAQTEKTFRAFHGTPKTMKQVAEETGIIRPNICRYVAEMKKHGKIIKVNQGKCPITHHSAGFYSTHPKYFPDEVQKSIFEPDHKRHAGILR